MKKILFSIVAIFCCLSIYSQDYYRRHTGYKAFADVDLSVDFKDGNNMVNCQLSTSHGYQFNGIFFLGGGFGVDVKAVSKGKSQVRVPLFGQTRINFTPHRISPYLDFKGGYSFADYNGAFVQPAFGVSFSIVNRFAINMGLVYTHTFSDDIVYNNNISLRFGLEF